MSGSCPDHDLARRDLASVPAEVFELWLDERISKHGWPPAGPAWEGALAGVGLDYLKSLRWVKEQLPLTPQDLGPRSLDRALRILDADVHGKRNQVANGIPDSARRFATMWEFIQSHGKLPAPLVLVSTFEGYEVVEGNHRVAAMLWCAAQKGTEGFFPGQVEAWVGALRS